MSLLLVSTSLPGRGEEGSRGRKKGEIGWRSKLKGQRHEHRSSLAFAYLEDSGGHRESYYGEREAILGKGKVKKGAQVEGAGGLSCGKREPEHWGRNSYRGTLYHSGENHELGFIMPKTGM